MEAVVRGLDPRTYPLEKIIFAKMMDGRVKPGHDCLATERDLYDQIVQ